VKLLEFQRSGGAVGGAITYKDAITTMEIGTITSHPLNLSTADTQRLTIAANGDISFYEDTGTTAKFFWDASAEELQLGDNLLALTPVTTGTTGSRISANGGGMLRLASGGSDKMYVLDSGNVGIGTSSPQEQIHSYAGGSNALRVSGGANNNKKVEIGYDNTNGPYIKAGSSGETGLQFYVDNTSLAATIDSSGNVLVGTTTAVGRISVARNLALGAALSVFGDTTGDTANTAMIISKFSSTNTTSQYFVDFVIGNNTVASGRITANGASAVTFSTYSDVTLKENIVTLPDQYDNIRALRPVEFDYIESMGGGHQLGFIAQEMQEIYPCCVEADPKTGKLQIAGWSKTEARLVSALQSAMSKIEALTARLDAAGL
jgi:hypothetical protein